MGRWTVWVAGAGFVICALLGACGGSTDQDPPASGTVPRDQLPARLAATFCENLAPCCRAEGFAHDGPTCQAAAEAELGASLAMVPTSNIIYDGVAAGRCLDEYARVIKTCQQPDSESVEGACAGVFKGTLPEGAPCTNDNECARPVGARARCNIAPSGGIGGGSGVGRGSCESDLSVVAVRGKPGEPCIGNCSTTENEASCSGAARPGAPNGATALCYRNDGLYCSSVSTLCVPLAQLGEACGTGGCIDGAFCDGGSCAPQRDTGPCGTTFDACSSQAYCDYQRTGECTPKRSDGAPCSTASMCLSRHCKIASTPGAPIAPAAGGTPGSSGTGGIGAGGTGGAEVVHHGVCAQPSIASERICQGNL